MTYDRYGDQYRWQFFQLLSFPAARPSRRPRETVSPFSLSISSSAPPTRARTTPRSFPFTATCKNRLFRDEIFFVMCPLYSQTRKKDVVTDNYLCALLSSPPRRRVARLAVLAAGRQRTQGRHHPDQRLRRRQDDRRARQLLCALAAVLQQPERDRHHQRAVAAGVPSRLQRAALAQRDSTTVIWPFFNYVDDREKKYREWDAPWPLIVFARGEGKTTTRVWPFFSQAHSATLESDFYLWPIYKYNRVHSAPLDTRAHPHLFLPLFRPAPRRTRKRRRPGGGWIAGRSSPTAAISTATAGCRSWRCSSRFCPTSKSIERDYSPLWSLWRSENNPKTGATSQSLLWNLYRREATPDAKKCSLLFGLFQYQSGSEGKRMRLFYIPLGGTKAPAHGEAKPAPARPSSRGAGRAMTQARLTYLTCLTI